MHQPYSQFVKLMKLVDSVNYYNGLYINLRIIVLKRNWIETIVSSCIHRFGWCKIKVNAHYKGFMEINKQLNEINQKYWIMIDYFDLCKRANKYDEILSKWLNIDDIELVQHGLSVIDDSKKNLSLFDVLKTDLEQIKRWDQGEFIEPDFMRKGGMKRYTKNDPNFSLMNTTLDLFSFSRLKHTVWIDKCVVVSPENIMFLDKSN
eukprot:170509_1